MLKNVELYKIYSNQFFNYMCCITPKRVTSLRAHLRLIAPAGNTASFEEMLQRCQAIGNTVSDLTGPRFEPQPSRSRDEHVTTWPRVSSDINNFYYPDNRYIRMIGNLTNRFKG